MKGAAEQTICQNNIALSVAIVGLHRRVSISHNKPFATCHSLSFLPTSLSNTLCQRGADGPSVCCCDLRWGSLACPVQFHVKPLPAPERHLSVMRSSMCASKVVILYHVRQDLMVTPGGVWRFINEVRSTMAGFYYGGPALLSVKWSPRVAYPRSSK